ncbi:MAG: ATP synthase subunit C [Spirochaetes bacterium]|jgi:V/A-type H+-transporting ATPase subunit K|nr:ATP synthase subunit C [Spirochaetota bacterium]
MSELITAQFVGAILALGLGAIGSSIGCGIAGMTSHGVMAKTDENHGIFLGLSAMPASQTIYGFVLMILLQNSTVLPQQAFGIGLCAGLAFMTSAIYQGKACSSAILGVSKNPGISGKVFMAPGIVESFALFALVGGIVLIQG